MKVMGICEINVRFTLSEYMRQCRDRYRERCDATRKAQQDGNATAMQ